MIDDPNLVTEKQMEEWVKDFNSWDICDQCCSNLFDKTKYAYKKANEWSGRNEVYVKRAGFVLMATLAVHDKQAGNKIFLDFLHMIKEHCTDERNFELVVKADRKKKPRVKQRGDQGFKRYSEDSLSKC
jgi:3-methyladenine DNA glycosylase AlkD